MGGGLIFDDLGKRNENWDIHTPQASSSDGFYPKLYLFFPNQQIKPSNKNFAVRANKLYFWVTKWLSKLFWRAPFCSVTRDIYSAIFRFLHVDFLDIWKFFLGTFICLCNNLGLCAIFFSFLRAIWVTLMWNLKINWV